LDCIAGCRFVSGSSITKIESSGKKWTIRRMDQTISIWERLNVRDRPGLGGKKLFLLHDFEVLKVQFEVLSTLVHILKSLL